MNQGRSVISADFIGRKSAKFVGRHPICTIVVDAEEDFDWVKPIQGTFHSVENMRTLSTFQDMCLAYNAIPTYLLTYPILSSEDIIFTLKTLLVEDKCDVGLQLHPWVTPPFGIEGSEFNEDGRSSFAENLPIELEYKKLINLKNKFMSCFNFAPIIYRAGRYGLSRDTLNMLENEGILIDTSVAPFTDFTDIGGPDYSQFNYKPFWFGSKRQLLEVPLCRNIVGLRSPVGTSLYRLGNTRFGKFAHLHGILSLLKSAERITLSPEGNDLPALKRLARSLIRNQSDLLVISFHSSSLLKGSNPYVSTVGDVRHFYDRLSGIMNYMMRDLDVRFVKLKDVPSYFQIPEPN